ncbi:hypothetical protein ACQJBY_071465 [Aegilops geniculata]
MPSFWVKYLARGLSPVEEEGPDRLGRAEACSFLSSSRTHACIFPLPLVLAIGRHWAESQAGELHGEETSIIVLLEVARSNGCKVAPPFCRAVYERNLKSSRRFPILHRSKHIL